MSVVIGLILASAIANAAPANNPGNWMSDLDYPPGAQARHEEGMVGYQILIAPDGSVMQCGVTRTSGSADLDAQTCVVLVRRAKFKAATDEQGNSTYNIWSGAINWTLPGQQPAKIPAGALNRLPQSDIELQVQQLPDGALEKSITVITRVDTSGHVAFCEGSKNDRDAVKLVAVACAQASALSLDVTKDNDGNPISMIRSLRVTFKVAA